MLHDSTMQRCMIALDREPHSQCLSRDATWEGSCWGAMLFLEIAEVAPDLVREKPEYWRKYLPRSRNEGYKGQIHLDRTVGNEDESMWYGGFDAHDNGTKFINGEPLKETDF